MEYLMTYGWAILIIAVVLGALFALGVFSGVGVGTACVAGPGYLCQTITLGPNGNLSFTFGQSTGSLIYNIGMGCASTSTSQGLPNPANAMVFIGTSGAATPNVVANSALTSNFAGSLNLGSGATTSVSALKCFSTTANALASPAIGTSFSGALWVNYTLGSGAPGGSNPMLTVKYATVTTKVV